MEKKKILTIVLIIVLLIVVLFAVNVARKMSILSSINEKVGELETNLTNCHIKMIYEGENQPYKEVNTYYKDGNKKTVINFSDGKEMIQFEYPTERKVFITEGENKQYSSYEESSETTTIYNIANETTIKDGMFATISSEKIDEKDCYVIGGKLSSFIYGENTKEITEYVEKDTGLTIKSVEIYEDNGIEKEKTTLIQTTFDVVTDSDMQEPNLADYNN